MSDFIHESHSIVPPDPKLDKYQRLGLILLGIGLATFFSSLFMEYNEKGQVGIAFSTTMLLVFSGGIIYGLRTHLKRLPGIASNNIMKTSVTSAGAFGWLIGITMTSLYVLYYWWPEHLRGMTHLFDPLSNAIRGKNSDQWFMYGALYTIGVIIMGIKAIAKYRHSRYQMIRTSSIICAQLFLAFLTPYIMERLSQPYFAPNYFWPLDYKSMMPDKISGLKEAGNVGNFIIGWVVVMFLIVTPLLTYYFGKRWYCSWVCGCGGLANTAGDSWRQLSSKKLIAWKYERVTIYSVLIFSVVMTVMVWMTAALGYFPTIGPMLQKIYGFLIGSVAAGVIGTGFYPIFGTRTWCRFGCPMAAVLGIIQKFKSRFRITTNGGQCISCGNCSTYCEMGIDVKWYAQRGQDIVRASCVGCGMCSAVCPRGVLQLENGPTENRGEYQVDLLSSMKARKMEDKVK